MLAYPIVEPMFRIEAMSPKRALEHAGRLTAVLLLTSALDARPVSAAPVVHSHRVEALNSGRPLISPIQTLLDRQISIGIMKDEEDPMLEASAPPQESATEIPTRSLASGPGSKRTFPLPQGELSNPRVIDPNDNAETTHVKVGSRVQICVDYQDLKGQTLTVTAAAREGDGWNTRRSFPPVTNVLSEDKGTQCVDFTKRNPGPSESKAMFKLGKDLGAEVEYTTD